MKKILTLLMLFGSLSQQLFAQPTQADIDKMKAEMEKLKKDPKNKELMKNMPNIDSLMKKMPKEVLAEAAKTKKKDTVLSLPARNASLSNALPNHVYSKAELVNYLKKLDGVMTNTLQTQYGTKIADLKDFGAGTIDQAAIFSWVNGQADQSILLDLKAAEKDPENDQALCNLGGLLNGTGLPVNAIPVLTYVLQRNPGNSTVLNNLGQAYIAMGESQKAEEYLMQCVSKNKFHPNANLTLAYINEARGNKSGALHYVENSLRGSFSNSANALLHKLKPDANLMNYIKERYKQPEYFNFHKYPLPPQCMTVDQAADLKKVYADYSTMIMRLESMYHQLSEKEGAIAKTTVPEVIKERQRLKQTPVRPFYWFGASMITDISIDFLDKSKEFVRYGDHYKGEIKALDEKYEAEMKKVSEKWKPILEEIGEGNPGPPDLDKQICSEKDAVGNSFLPQYAYLTQDYQKEAIRLYEGYYNDMMYWSWFVSIDDHQFRSAFYNMCGSFITELGLICTSKLIPACSNYYGVGKGTIQEVTIAEPKCPFDFKKAFGVGTFHLDCDGIQFEGGEGLILNVNHSFKTHQTTIGIGVGLEAKLGEWEFGAIKAEVNAGGKEQYFITFDGKGEVLDQGIRWEGQMTIKETVNTGLKNVKVLDVDVHGGWTLGVNSGFDFDKGTLFPFVDKFIAVIQK